MKTLILKELRENLKLAVIALLLSVAVVAGSQMYYVNLIKGIASAVSSPQTYSYRLQPLTSGNFFVFSMILCVVVGVALGWFQIHNERHRDLWAFLVHRPVTRTTIFLSKVIVGLSLYTLTVGLPLAYFVLWVKTPGHVAAPFEWGMAWPVLAALLTGVAWYFAGMLTSLRQARWYGSRALGIGAALLASYAIVNWWFAALMTPTLALAVWGAFHNRGQFQGQPVVGKAALTLSLVSGAGLVLVGGMALSLQIIVGSHGMTIWPHYTMGPDGVIYKMTESNGIPEIVSPDGLPVKDPDTGKPMELKKFNRSFGLGGVSAVSRGKAPANGPQSQWFYLFLGDRNTLWFNLNLNRAGRIEAYDVGTRRFIGSLGPDGFTTNKTGDGSGFLPKEQWTYNWSGDHLQLMASPKTVYQVDLENRAVKPLWTTADDNSIEACGGTINGENAVVLTHNDILLFHFHHSDVKPVWTIPFPHPDRDSLSVTLYGFTKAGEPAFSLWIGPSFWASIEGDATLPTHVLWLTKNGEITKREDLPALASPRAPQQGEQIVNAMLPPVAHLIPPLLSGASARYKIDWHEVQFGFGCSVLCALLGLWLGRRYSFSAKRQATWALFNLCFGVPGLLAFIGVQEWPAREKCDNCGKLRVVSNEKCEHCSSGFPPLKKNGTEIFEVQELCDR